LATPDFAGVRRLTVDIPRKSPSISVPADAIIFNGNGMQVAVVNNGKAEIRKVGVKRDLGTRLEVDSGIKAGDQVILNPAGQSC
jgi:copper(I)-binding protein